jgi:hypothetical protein
LDNAANGDATLLSNTQGNFNTANGARALESNTTAAGNIANGFEALANNTAGLNIQETAGRRCKTTQPVHSMLPWAIWPVRT